MTEPGYYEDGEFGIRLETIVMTTKVDTKVTPCTNIHDVTIIIHEDIYTHCKYPYV